MVLPDGTAWLVLKMDPVNAEAVARKKADPEYLDVFRVDGTGKAVRKGRVLDRTLNYPAFSERLGRAVADGVRDGRIDVVYVCSNADIARQNVNRLNMMGTAGFSSSTRLTMLPLELSGLRDNKVNFVSFTPGTSFEMKAGTVMARERALIYRMLQEAWGFGRAAAPINVLSAYASADTFRRAIDVVEDRNRLSELAAAGDPDDVGDRVDARDGSGPGIRDPDGIVGIRHVAGTGSRLDARDRGTVVADLPQPAVRRDREDGEQASEGDQRGCETWPAAVCTHGVYLPNAGADGVETVPTLQDSFPVNKRSTASIPWS